MNRQIKFRAWDTAKKQPMIYFGSKFEMDDDKNTISFEVEKDTAVYGDHDDTGDRFVLMQFTGLLDKNGKEIYEGDIVKSEGIEKTFIENVPDLLKLGHLLGEHIFVPDTVEIIGNIYQNPELLPPITPCENN